MRAIFKILTRACGIWRFRQVFLTSWLLIAASFLRANPADHPSVFIREVTVDGKPIPFDPNSSIRLPAFTKTTTITYGASESASATPFRLRCQLDGYETEWHERTDKMRLLIRFEDDALNEVGVKEFAVSGQSPGWTGSYSNSPCGHRKETVTIPANASRFWLVMSSAGPAGAVGIYGIKNLQFRSAAAGAEMQSLIKAMDARAPDALDPKRRNVEGWQRSGLRLSIAQVVRTGPDCEIMLLLVDDSPEAHADWITPKNPGLRVQPGDQLVFEWDECYSIGVAGLGMVSYNNLPAGLYRFRMAGLSLTGAPTGSENSVAVVVPVVFWQMGWFWMGMFVALAGFVMGAWRLTEWRRMKLGLAAIEKVRAVEQERFRIAQDIHDDLGARVTQISILSSAAQKKSGIPVAAQNDFASVVEMSRSLVDALYETVWAVSPENDHLDSLGSYIYQMTQQMCSQARLKCRLQIPDLPRDTPVTSGVRHNLIMVVKESIHNIIKHAEATEVQIQVRFEAQRLTIEIADNGKGFDSSIKLRGNGLANMQRRMAAVGGRLSQQSQPGAGTRIFLQLALSDVARLSNPNAPKP